MKALLLPLLFLLPALAFSQSAHRVAVNGKPIEFKELDRLRIVGHDQDYMLVDRAGGDREVSEKTAGLRKISALGLTDNTGFGISTRDVDGRIVVEQVGKSNGTIVIHVPNSAVVKFEQSTHRGSDLEIERYAGELDVSMGYHDIILRDVTGPVAANTVHGTIEAVYTSGGPREDIHLHSSYNNVDLSLPASTKADLRLYTGYGDMYTDFEITITANLDESGRRSKDERGLNGSINGGGTLISLRSGHGDVYLRQVK